MELLPLLVSILGGSAMLIVAAGWLASKFFENRLNRDIETYKARLKAESDAEIESLKSRLQVAAKEREITVTWLHQKRASSVEALYTALVDLRQSVRLVLDIFSPSNPADIRKYTAEAIKRTQEVYSNYLKAKIFMAPLTCEKIERVLDGLHNPLLLYYGYLGNYDDHELETLSDVKEHAWKEIRDSVPPALEELETEFRQLLGVGNG
jgi:hypothetical protein